MRALSGIQPSGRLHLGNYFGMMKPALELQAQGEAFLFIADYHALTSVSDPQALRQATRDVALDFLACGLNPEKTVFYRQSDVPEVHELSWLLSTVTPLGLLERCHSYKDKVARGLSANHALFAYPVLMAADILAVQADVVPVGQDQKQHVEVTRDIALKFNQKFGEVFKIPAPSIRQTVAVVPGIDGQKMSKTYNNTLELFGAPTVTARKIMRIVTDSRGVAEPKDPAQCHVFALYKLLVSAAEAEAMAERYQRGGLGYGEVKKALIERMQKYFEPFRLRREAWQQDPERLEQILLQGAARARVEISKTLQAARRAVGLT